MKTINDSHKIQCLEETICNHKKAIAQQTLAKQQLVDFYIKSAHAIATQLKNLLSINDGYEFSLLFNLPKADNREILKSWVIDYLINNNVDGEGHYSLEEIAETFKYEIAVKQQDYYYI